VSAAAEAPVWIGWLACHGTWERVCGPASLSAAHQALVAAQAARGCRRSLHGVLTGGGSPTYPPPADRCGAQRGGSAP